MRVSDFFELQRNQSELDFVDIDTVNDIPVYIDPSSIRWLRDGWSEECTLMLTTFFDSVLDGIKGRDEKRTFYLLNHLREPNETHLGLSRGKSAGRALGPELIEKLTKSLMDSKAAQSGLLEDLEDTSLFIPGVGKDIISDITTNIIRGALINYTQSICDFYSIPLDRVPSGAVWDPHNKEWEEGITSLPVSPYGKILLVPKIIVRMDLHLNIDEYYSHHLIPTLEQEELDNPASRMVQTLKNGKRKVLRGELRKEFRKTKANVTDFSLERPGVFQTYKEVKVKSHPTPLSHEQVELATGGARPDFDQLLSAVLNTPKGSKHASEYHNNVENLLSSLFYPELSMPVKEKEILEGRKRVDICYANTSKRGFFHWLIAHKISCQYIYVECKNYSQDIENPELDQISSRFSPMRGRVGIITCRSFSNKSLFLKRCRDTALDGRGFVLLLDDGDLKEMVDDMKRSLLPIEEREEMEKDWQYPWDFPKLRQIYENLIL
ncbi:hypothetical protein [Nocardiopsis dassonvillei]|uniref:hypothetical protein n=1 Tax=Nocardiopsis dassonvillei TaxID=2014 RepID=UPI00366FDC68